MKMIQHAKNALLNQRALLGLAACLGIAWPWVVTLRRMTEIHPRPVGFVDDLSAVCLLTACLLAFRLLPKWVGRIGFLAFAVAITSFVLSNDLYFEFYRGYLGPAVLSHVEDADSAGPSALLLFSWGAIIWGLVLPILSTIAWFRIPPAPPQQTFAQILLFVMGVTAGQVAFANRFSPIYMHRKENALMFFIRATIKVAVEGMPSNKLTNEEQQAIRTLIPPPDGFEASHPEHPLFLTPIAPPAQAPSDSDAGVPEDHDAGPPPPQEGKTETPQTDRPNVIVVMLESVRASEMGIYGAPVSATPNLDKLARENVYAKTFYANANQTVRGELAVFCGLLDRMRAASNITMNHNLRTTCLQEILKANGYSTHWFHGNTKRFFRRENFFLKHGFDQLHDEDYLKEIEYEYKPLGWGVPDTAMVRYAVDILKKEDKPFFAEIMTLSNHHPFNWNWPLTFPQELRPDSKHPMDRYRHGIYFTDHAVGLLMQLLEEADLLKNTYVAFLGDHGIWLFDERKGKLHESQEYEQYFRLPFIVTGPDIEQRVIQAPSSQVDVSPTILDLLGLEPSRAMIGRSMLDPATPATRAIWMHQEASFNFRNGDLRCHIPMGPCRGDKYLRCFTGKKEVSQHVCFESGIDLLSDSLASDSLKPVSVDAMQQGVHVSSAIQKLLRANKIRPLKDSDISNYMTGKKLKKQKQQNQ